MIEIYKNFHTRNRSNRLCTFTSPPTERSGVVGHSLVGGGGGLPPWGELNETINKSINSSIKLLKSTNSLCKKKKKAKLACAHTHHLYGGVLVISSQGNIFQE